MQFGLDKNYKAPELLNQVLGSFRGVDYSNATLSIATNRSPDATNWIFKDGINQKRNGFTQVAYKNGKINGYWEFKDSNSYIHKIMQVGTTFYELSSNAAKIDGYDYNELSINYKPNYYTTEEWSTYLSNIRNEKSYGVVRGDRLYIFAGIFLVYGKWSNTWELRAVRDNEDTYIPVVTTNIDYEGYKGQITRAALEDINMMSCRRKARLISPLGEEALLDITDNSDNSLLENNTFWSDYEGSKVSLKVKTDIKYSKVKIEIYDSNDAYVTTYYYAFGATNNENYQYDGTNLDVFGQGYTTRFNRYEFLRTASFEEGKVSYTYGLVLGFGDNIYSFKIFLDAVGCKYVIDLNGIDNVKTPTVKYINGDAINGENQITWDYNKGELTINYLEKYNSTHTPDIEVEYSPKTASTDYQKIDGCRFGCIFGYNAIEHLFASGNSSYPNVDWHTNESFFESGNIPDKQNLTYWSDLSYEYLGGQQSAIKSYIVLSDNTLAILKENIPHEYTLFVRSPFMSAAITYDGETVRDRDGNAYQKLYYNTIACAMGIGCISTYASANYDGDKMFLSDTGVYGIEITENTASPFNTQRFARNRSFFINPKLLTNIELLRNASSIVYRGKYYLALNDGEGTVYVADKVDSKDTDYTHVYEWYCLKGIKANSWFINIENKLGYTTDDGRVLVLNEEYYDKEVDLFNSLSVATSPYAIDYDSEHHTFGTFLTNASDLLKVKDYSKIKVHNSNLFEKICSIGDIYYDAEIQKFRVNSRTYIDYLQYYEDDNLYLYDENYNIYSCTISDMDSTDYTVSINAGELEFEHGYIPYGLIAPLNEEYAMVNIEEGSNNNYTFQLLARNGVDASKLLYITQSVANLSLPLTVAIINEKPIVAKWYTPIMNMGDSNYAKTLKYFTIIPERSLRGEVSMSFITRVKETNINIEGLDYLESFGDVDISSISIDPTLFAKSFTKKFKIRNFNFLQLLFESNNTSNAALHNISLTYIVGKRNRGVK